jgi:hypothetical protein
MPSGISTTRTSGSGNLERIRARAGVQRRSAPRLAWLGGIACACACAWSFERSALGADAPDDRDKALPCRPTIACTADLVPPGTLDVETGVLFRRLGASGGAATPASTRATRATRATRQWSFPFIAKLTLARWVQLQAGSNGFTAARGDAPASFFDDAVFGAKFHLHDQTDATPSVSASIDASVPTPGPELGYERTYDAAFTAYVTKDVGPVHADFNAILNVWRIDGAPLEQGLFALALTANVPPPFGVMGEAYVQTDASPVSSRDGGFLFAFTHSPRPWLVFDVGGDVGWFPSARSYSLFIGMSFVPVVFWRPAERPGTSETRMSSVSVEVAEVSDPAWKNRRLPASSAIR